MNLKVFSLENCYYSMSANNLLKYEDINFNLESVNHNNKEMYKNKNKMNTFPQIFLEDKNLNIKIGGYSELKLIIDVIKNYKNFDIIYNKLLDKLNLPQKEILLIIKYFTNIYY
jgi:glutaredoxin